MICNHCDKAIKAYKKILLSEIKKHKGKTAKELLDAIIEHLKWKE